MDADWVEYAGQAGTAFGGCETWAFTTHAPALTIPGAHIIGRKGVC